ncbi:MAG: hypothetical protein NTW19_22545 [Planctomycetota bacterium]|nr:hypothetical protein [Planctomycetota bacterium]
MTKRDFGILTARVIALLVIFQAVIRIELVVSGVYQLFDAMGEERSRGLSIAVMLTSLLPFLAMLALGIYLWGRASRVAGLLLHGIETLDDPGFQANGRGAYRLAFATIGLYLVVDAMPRMAGAGYFYLALRNTPAAMRVTNPDWLAGFLAVTVELIAGLGLLLAPTSIVRVVDWFDRLNRRETPVPKTKGETPNGAAGEEA